MIQINYFSNLNDCNKWLKEASKHFKILEVKFQSTYNETYETRDFLVVYEIEEGLK